MAKLDGGALMEVVDHPLTFFVALTLIVGPIVVATILVFQWLGLLGPGATGREGY